MPADRLTTQDLNPRQPLPELPRVEAAVLRVLAGISVTASASVAGLPTADLTEAVAAFHRAGRDALQRQAAANCWQAYIEFEDWDTSRSTADTKLAPALHSATAVGATWWFIRKYPCWRLRLHNPSAGNAAATIAIALDDLVKGGAVRRWWQSVYEPEEPAFGGPLAMTVAHTLFHADSTQILNPPTVPLGQRELSVLLCTAMFRAAGAEWYEQGDVWHRVSLERPFPSETDTSRLDTLIGDVHNLLHADTSADGPLFGITGPLMPAARWAEDFRRAGRELGEANRTGALERGLRQVLSYHVIFHWNRLGLPTHAQALLAAAASRAILEEEPTDPDGRAAIGSSLNRRPGSPWS